MAFLSSQVMRFRSSDLTKPDLVVGVRLEPGSDGRHFCQPTDVAVLVSGQFYVADG